VKKYWHKIVLLLTITLTLLSSAFAKIESDKTYYGRTSKSDEECSIKIFNVKLDDNDQVIKFSAKTDSRHQLLKTHLKKVNEFSDSIYYSSIPKFLLDKGLYDFPILKILYIIGSSALNIDLDYEGNLISYQYHPPPWRTLNQYEERACYFLN
jgi:hypothetical protein